MTKVQLVALYARVSTLDKGQDPEMQLRELRAHAQAQGWEIFSEYIDNGVSGSKGSRPQLNRLMSDAQAGKFSAVVVWKLDRFGRSVPHLVNSIADLDRWKVSFISLKENIDLSTPIGRLQFHILSALAQFYREMTVENVRAGLRHAKAKGKTLGKPRRDDIDVSKIRALRAGGVSWRTIARKMGVPASTCRERCTENLDEMAMCG